MLRHLATIVIWVGAALLLVAIQRPTAATRAAINATPLPTATMQTSGDAARGKALFAAKGCVTCHTHSDVPSTFSVNIGPDLTHYQPNAAFVRRWLADPPAVRPGTTMPQLNLQPDEIEDLLAFLQTNTPR